MLKALKSVRTQPPILFSSPLQYRIGRRHSELAFRTNQSEKDDSTMEKQPQKSEQTNNRNAKTEDLMSHSFGEGYATRSDEEGFGGIYGGNDSYTKEEQQGKIKIIHENHPEYDKSQGSEVAEKEKARQPKTAES